ncbi:NADH-quinone oxidoreductase subunit C [Paenibacillaceae bacterium]|nr:NADH-quinone oxidoreductase subunit C [Paenibacillaceae bacterium]
MSEAGDNGVKTPDPEETEAKSSVKGSSTVTPPETTITDAEDAEAAKEAKRQAAAEARAARAAAKAAAEAEAAPAEPKPPSPNQPRLELAAGLLKEAIGESALEEAYINELNGDVPSLIVKPEHIQAAAALFMRHESLGCNYLRNISGVDYETHMEVVYHLVNLATKHDYVLKVRLDREAPAVHSVTPLWATANWNEREIFDLLGVQFIGHPDLRRIMMSDDWVGHPLRKDYKPLDSEV